MKLEYFEINLSYHIYIYNIYTLLNFEFSSRNKISKIYFLQQVRYEPVVQDFINVTFVVYSNE